ncbi:MAG TPA: YidC/Oxa1 family membrane protein insertase [Clostridiaceae bacterium]|nr:YidC/Oxa1 family membrane protein insertase [Clostridiaceae bacterium]
MNILDPIAEILGQFLYFIYNTMAFGNYGVAILIFTLITKLALLPLNIKQYRSTAKMQEIQPLINEIQRKYKNDKEKLNQELMKVYQDNNINPASGCFPMLVQLPIILSLYWVIIQPLKFMLKKTAAQIVALKDIANVGVMASASEINVLRFFSNNQHLFNSEGNIVFQAIKSLKQAGNFVITQTGELADQAGNIVLKIGDVLLNKSELINFRFLGLDLSEKPTYDFKLLFSPETARIYLPLLILPILGVITTYISTKMSTPPAPETKGKNKQSSSASTPNSMLYVGPIMTLFFSFQLPAGVILYWIAGYVFQIFQQLYINKYVLGKKEVK